MRRLVIIKDREGRFSHKTRTEVIVPGTKFDNELTNRARTNLAFYIWKLK